MDMPAKKFYVVWKGIRPGVYETWKECEAQIRGVEGALYKSFPDRVAANRALLDGWKAHIGRKKDEKAKKQRSAHEAVQESLSVDAACSGNPGELEYRGVDTRTGIQLFHQGPFPLGTVNIGEFLAIVHALAYLHKRGSSLPVYSDSRTAIKWTRDKAIKTNLPRNSATEALFELVDRAVNWLKTHNYTNQILKWETDLWGEIPADFGRK
jgi:ribonuclease HI